MRVTDIGCDNFQKAAESRKKVKEKLFIQAYLEIESVVKNTPLRSRLPSWIPQNQDWLN